MGDRLAEIDQRLRELRQVRRLLRGIAERAASYDPDDCGGYCGLIMPDATDHGGSAA